MPAVTAEQQVPYRKFQPSSFWTMLFPHGTYTAMVQGCNWTCEGCWSGAGWRGRSVSKGMMLTAEQVAHKLVEGCKRNAQNAARISGGEAGIYWAHTEQVIYSFLERTRDIVIDLGELTGPAGEPASIVIETNASTLTPQDLDRLEEQLGEDAERVVIALGFKATHPAALQELTGMTLATCERFHAKQLALLLHAAYHLKHLQVHAAFIDRYTDPHILSAIMRSVERGRPGMGRNIGVVAYKHYRSTKGTYVPKRLRTEHRDVLPADDEETLNALATKSGLPRSSVEQDDSDPVAEIEDLTQEPESPGAALGREFHASLLELGVRDGELRIPS